MAAGRTAARRCPESFSFKAFPFRKNITPGAYQSKLLLNSLDWQKRRNPLQTRVLRRF